MSKEKQIFDKINKTKMQISAKRHILNKSIKTLTLDNPYRI